MGEGGMGASTSPSTRSSASGRHQGAAPASSRQRRTWSRASSTRRARRRDPARDIVDVLDFGKLADGSRLLRHGVARRASARRALQREGRLRARRARSHIVHQVAGALGAAHAQRHRAPRSQARQHLPRPDASADGDFVKVLDFGIAKLRATRRSARRDAHRRGHRHADVHVARAVPRPPGRSAQRHLLARRDHVRDAHRAAAVQRRGFGELLVAHMTQPPVRSRPCAPAAPHLVRSSRVRWRRRPTRAFSRSPR